MSQTAPRRTRKAGLLGRAGLLGAAMTLLIAGPAAAHPFVQGGGEVPVDSLATITLDLAHGCDTEAEGEGADTTDVAVQVPEWMRVVDVPETEGWEFELETDDDGALEVVSWTEDGGAEPAPTFDLDVVASGTAGEAANLGVFQACDDFEYRWIGTDEEPAEDPAINITFVDADPDSPAPPEEDDIAAEATEEEDADDAVEDDEAADPDAEDGAQDDAPDDGTQDDAPDDAAQDDEVADEADDAGQDAVEDDADEDVAADDAAAEDDDSMPTVLIVLIVLAVIAAVAAAVVSRNKKTSEG